MRKLSYEEILEAKPSVEEVKAKKRNPIYVVLDNVRSLYNVGAILRTADAVLVEKVFMCGITGHPPRKEISKTALGAEELVPWEYRDDAEEVLEEMKENGVQVVAVELAEGAKLYTDFEYEKPVCLVFGHEVEGVSDELMELVDEAVYLPMLGRANSLNVATCFGVMVYEVMRKWGGDNG